MSAGSLIFRNGPIFDGTRLLHRHAARFSAGILTDLSPDTQIATDCDIIDLAGDILAPGFVDLQVNGGGGTLFNADPSVAGLRRIAAAHRRLGVTAFLPTLITDTPAIIRAAIVAVVDAIKQGVPGVAGLHLEGPHLSTARKGAHDAGLIRPMAADDLARLLDAARQLPVLKITVAPESVTEPQVFALADAGILVSLGHTDADYDTCRRYLDAGARCVTHLFNAMSQLGSRAPGLVGAALDDGRISAGMIADGIHVHPASLRAAWAAKTGPGRIFLVSDAMSVAGTDGTGFDLGGRQVRRQAGALRLADGTLAGADLDMTTAIRVLVERAGVPLETALQAAITVPAGLIGRVPKGAVGGEWTLADTNRISADLSSCRSLDHGNSDAGMIGKN